MDIKSIMSPENQVRSKSKLLLDTPMHYCPGCSHGVVHKLVAEIIEEMDILVKSLTEATDCLETLNNTFTVDPENTKTEESVNS